MAWSADFTKCAASWKPIALPRFSAASYESSVSSFAFSSKTWNCSSSWSIASFTRSRAAMLIKRRTSRAGIQRSAHREYRRRRPRALRVPVLVLLDDMLFLDDFVAALLHVRRPVRSDVHVRDLVDRFLAADRALLDDLFLFHAGLPLGLTSRVHDGCHSRRPARLPATKRGGEDLWGRKHRRRGHREEEHA